MKDFIESVLSYKNSNIPEHLRSELLRIVRDIDGIAHLKQYFSKNPHVAAQFRSSCIDHAFEFVEGEIRRLKQAKEHNALTVQDASIAKDLQALLDQIEELCVDRIQRAFDEHRKIDVVTKQTKKLLVGFDPSRAEDSSSDFLVPLIIDRNCVLYGLTSRALHTFGLVVYTGGAVTEEYITARFKDVGAGGTCDDEKTRSDCLKYINDVQSFNIGNIVCVSSEPFGLLLRLVANTPSAFMKRYDVCCCNPVG